MHRFKEKTATTARDLIGSWGTLVQMVEALLNDFRDLLSDPSHDHHGYHQALM